ncbi:Structural maintenance of chromosomes protein 3, partial [Monoraphidium neglectum]
MRQEERQALLHEGAGHAVLSAFVELVFDNSDGRFPVRERPRCCVVLTPTSTLPTRVPKIDKDEVRLRRTIGAKKDEYTLDRKHVTKQEVMNLLESAGFSRANPYYIVQQGKIMSMANMKDGERLELLKEIGGTKVYEERRRESLKIMQETENRRAQIEEVVEFIESKLQELDAEKAELAAFQALDRQRRSIEYALFDKELAEARSKAAKVEAERAKLGEEAAAAQKEAAAAKERLVAVEAASTEAQEAKASAEKARRALAKERDAALKQRAKLELDEKEAAGKLAADTESSTAAKAELARLYKQIADAERQCVAAATALEEKRKREKEVHDELSSSQGRLQALMSKQGRSSQFASQGERDAFLKGEAKKLQDAAAKQESARAALQQQVEELNAVLMAGAQAAGDKEQVARDAAGALEAVSRQLAELKKARDEAANQRKEAWRAADELKDQFRAAESEHARAREAAQRVIPRDISMGIMAMEAARRAHNIKGVYGSLADLLEVPAQLSTAVEVVCGNQAFQVVVDTTDTGMRLVQELNRQRSGRVTFMPLDALRVQEVAYPTEWGDAAVPMHRVLKYDERFKTAVMQVFGKTLVCQTREIAEKVASGGVLDAITLDGDLVRRKGTVSGGFSDPMRNKIGSHQKARTHLARGPKPARGWGRHGSWLSMPRFGVRASPTAPAVKALEQRLAELTAQKKAHEAAAAEHDHRADQLSAEVAQLEGRHKHMQQALEQARRDVKAAQAGDAGQRKALKRAEDQLAEVEVGGRGGCCCFCGRGGGGAGRPCRRGSWALASAGESLADVARKLAVAREEMQTDMLEQLSPTERKQLGELQPRVAALKESLEAAKAEHQQAAAKLEGLQTRLETNLLRRRDELATAAEEGTPAEAASLDGLRAELARAAEAVEGVEEQLAEAEARAAAAAEKAKAADREREALAEAVKRGGGGGGAEGGEGARLEALAEKAAAARQRADDLSRRIKELGTLPSDAFEKYRGKNTK